ncbi:HET-domain-containing protein [Pyrenochaeta sp. DS3sAY3a]|nr:HET-domain-containing protein [Pyrenochaeta sp. DS3sAY3a]
MRYRLLAVCFAFPCLATACFINHFLETRNEKWIKLSILAMATGTCFIVYAALVDHSLMDNRPSHRRKARLHRAGYPTYVYKRLDISDSKSIRLIELLPLTKTDIENDIYVRIKMHTVSLHDPNAPEYEAISYCWGDATHLEPILCNDAVFQVTNSLHCALRRLNHYDRSRFLWADALCINQTDTEEKNFQVRLMGEVYRHATRVLIYLGEDVVDIRLLEKLIPTLVRARERREELGIPVSIHLADRYYAAVRYYAALHALLSRTWFSRVWIIQEIALAKDAILFCGDLKIPWGDLVAAFKMAQKLRTTGQQDFRLANYRLERLESSRTPNSHYLLDDLLSVHRGAGVTDPRDQIYGLLGLAKDGGLFEVDYSKSVAEVYVDAAKNMLLSSSSLKILHLLVTPQGGRDPLLPSWVPDWRVDILHESLADLRADLKKVHINFSSNGRRLIIRGTSVDTIEMIGVCYPRISYNEDNTLWKQILWGSSLDKWLATFRPYFSRPYPTRGVDFSVAFWDLVLQSSHSIDGRHLKYLKVMFRVNRWISSLPLDNVQLQMFATYFLYDATFLLLTWIAQARTGRPIFPVGLSHSLEGRRMMTTEKGYLGLCPASAKEGDQVFIIDGCQTPMVLRRTPADEDGYELIGECSMYRYEAEYSEDDAKYQSLALV